ncbi:MAG: oligosaccharide flippase family protein [Moraxellaceae bacterium]|nr:oligosaccharide flippase family protein [Moraxellaceae bacterium]MCP5177551.1 oligosaccharide flippase family protein [Moraxellaceae bacterium]
MVEENTRSVFQNATALMIMQIASYLLPLILIPYLTRVLGVTLYGITAFGLAIVQIAAILTDYGFVNSATYKIAREQGDKLAVRKIISSVMACKILLVLIVTVLLGIFILTQDKYQQYESFLWLLLLPILGQTFQPLWFFQGIERMALITIYTVSARILYLVLAILLVNSPKDYAWVAVANGAGQVVAAVIGIAMMIRMGYTPVRVEFSQVRQVFKESTQFFWSRAAVSTYTAGGAFFLGLTSTPLQVAYYSAAEQLYRGAQALMQPIAQALFPYMAKNKDFTLFFKILKLMVVLALVGALVGSLLGEWIINIIFGPEFYGGYPVLVVLIATLVLTVPSVLLGYPFLGALGAVRHANLSVIIAGCIQMILLFCLYFGGFKSAVSVALTVFSVEFFVLSYRGYYARKLWIGWRHQ